MGFFEGVKGMFSQSGADKAEEWQILEGKDSVDKLLSRSESTPQLIYKHSDRCSVCIFAKSNLEQQAGDISEATDMNFVDVISSRDVSNYIADKLNVRHESPQAILLNEGEVVWHASHGSVKAEPLMEVLRKN
ncbi:bacillithiol system redox-active protein YtxJ [Balneolaceae bacterium YR4-1]|uniref:Bacillithiol system redox-active protein YtxJ n=1 Tax=Halalkalibaculum roseum TaxID=2709311 RepID=A0A6M1T0S9_9BACT|nr:bacillithiol system redox-active protein YtxJ [Halalkalibaculum roseum]NGP77124.1 bacillithiol system redox-active protein YtxJ [Halalkalibaculum roseum]